MLVPLLARAPCRVHLARAARPLASASAAAGARLPRARRAADVIHGRGRAGASAALSTSAPARALAEAQAQASEKERSVFDALDTFTRRHVGPQDESVDRMLRYLGASSLDALVDECMPASIREHSSDGKGDFLKDQGAGKGTIEPLSERELLARARQFARQNKVFRSFIGLGYHQAVVPPVILRNMTENHSWFSQYTPYQPEISQGRLESLINFQTMSSSLTGLDIANASLLDEGTAAAEAMVLSYGQLRSAKHTFLVDSGVFPQTLAVLQTRAAPFGIKIKVGDVREMLDRDQDAQNDLVGCLVQYPDQYGSVDDLAALARRTHELGGLVSCATDLLALTVLKPPGEWGADIAFGNSARFGVPLGFGGPHAAFFACVDKLKRKLPGRLVGLSRDVDGKPAYRLALQTREQHIRRDKATSNICTAQALLANMAAMYAVYHGPHGLRQIAHKVHGIARTVHARLDQLGHKVVNPTYFDTLHVRLAASVSASELAKRANEREINVRVIDDRHVGVTFDESNMPADIADLLDVFASSDTHSRETLVQIAKDAGVVPAPTSLVVAGDGGAPAIDSPAIPHALVRTSAYLTQPVWNSHHSETDILRYMHYLQSKDLSLVHAPIPLGSCTMKLNATTAMVPFTWPEFANIHPFAPSEQTQGYLKMMQELSDDLATLTGFHSCSLQPNSGAQGEYAGLMTIRAYHHSRGDTKRNVCLIPVSAHGTNPASAVMSGMTVVAVKTLNTGELDLHDLKAKAEKHRDSLSAFMVTYPSTYGAFEHTVTEACKIVHDNGGQVYLDGANMNAMVGLSSPGKIGADVCHLNLHKTFSIPHGGGGPGVGPICCAEHLAPFLPGHPTLESATTTSERAVSSAPFGSASITSISWAYIKMLGGSGLTYASKIALLNANYAAARLKDHYKVRFTNENGRCAHEFLIDLAEFDKSAGLNVMDFAKRLQDYGIHPPTCSWPISTAMLIEPTESEGLRDVDALCDAMIHIAEEARMIARGEQPRDKNVIKGAPHTIEVIASENWDRPYSREMAAFPVPRLRRAKFWPKVSRVDDAFGDRELVCECGTVEEYL